MGDRRNFKVGDFVTLSGSLRLIGKIESIDHLIHVKWDNPTNYHAYTKYANPLIYLTEEDILDRIMKKYYGYKEASV